MLALKLGLSLNTLRNAVFSPTDKASLEAWYQKATGIVLTGGLASEISAWNDQSSNSIDMVQATLSEQPTYAAGVVTFDGSDNLQSTSQISLTGDYTIGVYFKPTGTVSNYAVVGDNTTAGQFIKLQDDNTIYIKSGGSVKGISLTSGARFIDGGYFVLTRDSSNFTLFWNGVQEAQVAAVAGTQLLDTIGARATDVEDYIGDITEIQIYSSTSAALTASINTRFSTL